MGAGTPLLRRRLWAALALCTLSLTAAACTPAPPVVEAPPKKPDRVAGVRLGVIFGSGTILTRNEPNAVAAGRSEIAQAITSGLVPFLTEERPDVWPRQRIVAAVAVRGVWSGPEGTDVYADMRLRRGPGEIASGFESPVRIRMLRRHDYLVVVGFDRPGDDTAWWHDDMRYIFPKWIIPELNEVDDPRLVAELDRVDRAFVMQPKTPPAATSQQPRVPADERTERPVTGGRITSERKAPGKRVTSEHKVPGKRVTSERKVPPRDLTSSLDADRTVAEAP